MRALRAFVCVLTVCFFAGIARGDTGWVFVMYVFFVFALILLVVYVPLNFCGLRDVGPELRGNINTAALVTIDNNVLVARCSRRL